MPATGEWKAQADGWYMLHLASGNGYFWQRSGAIQEVAEGSVLVISGRSGGSFRASRLNAVTVNYFYVDPAKLGGLLTLAEQTALDKAALSRPAAERIFSANHPCCQRLRELFENRAESDIASRLQAVELFVSLFQSEIKEALAPAESADGRNRLRQVLANMAQEDLMALPLSELALRMRCSPRHVRRLFREELGTSFRDKQTELRLAKACNLLATSRAKVVDVALNSGYQSNSLFSLLFKNRFGLTPGQWRQQYGQESIRDKSNRMLSA